LGAKFSGVTLIMKENVLFDPMYVCFFRPDAIVFEANDLANLFKKTGHGGRTSERESNHSEDQLSRSRETR
jgi:hypothetical protein